MKLQLSAAAVLTVALLTGCGPKPQADVTADPAATPAVADAAVTPAADATAGVFTVDPASLNDCNGVVATVKWDVRAKHPNVADVEIYVGPDSAPTLFAAGGNFGDTQTGPWTAPGAIFRLRDKATGAELERATVAGPACQ